MKIEELLNMSAATSNAEVLLVEMDWDYDIDMNNVDRFGRGMRKLEAIKTQLRKIDESTAQNLWEQISPWSSFQTMKRFLEE